MSSLLFKIKVQFQHKNIIILVHDFLYFKPKVKYMSSLLFFACMYVSPIICCIFFLRNYMLYLALKILEMVMLTSVLKYLLKILKSKYLMKITTNLYIFFKFSTCVDRSQYWITRNKIEATQKILMSKQLLH